MANKSWIYQEYLPVIHYKTLGDPYATTLGNNRDVCMYVSMYVCIYVCMYVYTCIYIINTMKFWGCQKTIAFTWVYPQTYQQTK